MGICCSKSNEETPLKPGELYNKNFDYQRVQNQRQKMITQASEPNALMYFYDPLTGTYIPSENMDKDPIPASEWRLGYH